MMSIGNSELVSYVSCAIWTSTSWVEFLGLLKIYKVLLLCIKLTNFFYPGKHISFVEILFLFIFVIFIFYGIQDISCIKDLTLLYEAATIEDIYVAYQYLKVDDASLFSCIGVAGEQLSEDLSGKTSPWLLL